MPHATSSWHRFCSTCLQQNQVCKIFGMTLPSCAVAVDVSTLIWSKQMCLVGRKIPLPPFVPHCHFPKGHSDRLPSSAECPKETTLGGLLLQVIPFLSLPILTLLIQNEGERLNPSCNSHCLLLHAAGLAQEQYLWQSLVQILQALDALVPSQVHSTFHPWEQNAAGCSTAWNHLFLDQAFRHTFQPLFYELEDTSQLRSGSTPEAVTSMLSHLFYSAEGSRRGGWGFFEVIPCCTQDKLRVSGVSKQGPCYSPGERNRLMATHSVWKEVPGCRLGWGIWALFPPSRRGNQTPGSGSFPPSPGTVTPPAVRRKHL